MSSSTNRAEQTLTTGIDPPSFFRVRHLMMGLLKFQSDCLAVAYSIRLVHGICPSTLEASVRRSAALRAAGKRKKETKGRKVLRQTSNPEIGNLIVLAVG